MTAEIIPLLKMSKGLGSFSYAIPLNWQKNIATGQIVQINFRNIKTIGIVENIDKKSKQKFKFKLKEIEKIITPLPIVTPTQIELINFIANYYGLAKGLVARAVVKINQKFEIRNLKENLKIKNQKSKLRNKDIKIIKQKNRKTEKQMFWYRDGKEALNLVREKGKNVLNNKGQMLVLAPEVELVEKIASLIGFEENKIVKMHSRLKKTETVRIWQEILNGQSKIIIGTKMSVLLPFVNLQNIIIFNEEDWNHKQSDINPRYDARIIAEWLAKKNGAELILTTAAPSVETYYKIENGKGQIAKTRNKKIKQDFLNVLAPWSSCIPRTSQNDIALTLIDLKNERLGGNYGSISNKLLEKIEEKLSLGQKIFLFHNRIGFAKFIQCKDCEYVFKCPQCQATFNYENKNKQLFCSQCGYKEDVAPFCPKCGNADIKFKSAGVQKVKSELQKILPGVIIKEIDKGTNAETTGAQIVVATKFALNKIDLQKYSLVAFINFDQLLNVADFRASEKAYQLFYEIFIQNPNAEYVLQTNETENYVIQSITQNNYDLFYEKELALRKDFDYPPFKQLIKITNQNKKENLALGLLEKISKEMLVKWPEIIFQNIIANNPPRVRGNYKYHLILKLPLNFELNQLLTFLPNDVIIDINPERVN